MFALIGIVSLSYAFGCVCTGYYAVRVRTGRDLRNCGSGSLGARNAGRVLGAPGFAVVLVADAGKGALAVWLATALSSHDMAAGSAMVAVVLGHVFPAQLGFKGGKGAATFVGALAMLSPQTALAFAAVLAVALAATRHVVASGMVAFAAVPVVAWPLTHDAPSVFALCASAALVLVAHRSNIGKIIGRREERDGAPDFQGGDGATRVRADSPAELSDVRGGDPPARAQP